MAARSFVGGVHVIALLATCAITAACVTPTPPAAGERSPPSALRPQPGLSAYDADLAVDRGRRTLDVNWRISYVADSATARQVAFLLNRGFDVRHVRGNGVASFRVVPPEEPEGLARIVVSLDGTAAPGSVVALEIAYGGRPEFGSGFNAIGEDWTELNLDGFWHPVAATFDQQLMGVLRVRLPVEWEIVSSGTVHVEAGAHVIHSSVPQVDVAFVAAPGFERDQGAYFTAFHRGASAEAVSAVLRATDACARYLNARFGGTDSLQAGRVVLTDRAEVSYARKNFVVLSRVDPTAPVPLNRFICHELAHFWTRSPNFMSPDHWMSEAFAELVSGLFVRDELGEEAFQGILTQWEEVGRNHGPIWSADATRRPNQFVMYRRAPYLLYQLEQRIGRESFAEFVRHYMSHGVLTTPALLDVLREIAGAEVARWFRAELERVPERSTGQGR